MGLARHAAWRTALVIGALLAALALPAASPAATSYPEPPTTFEPGARGRRTSRSRRSARRSTTRLNIRRSWPLTVRPAPPQPLAAQAADPGRFFTNNLCWNRGNGCAGDIRLDNWAANGYGIVRAGAVHRARRRDAFGPSVGDCARPGEASRRRHHQRLGAGRRTDVLVRGADAREGRLRRAHVRPAGPRPERHARRGARRTRGCAGADRRPALLRRHRGCDRLLPLQREAPV